MANKEQPNDLFRKALATVRTGDFDQVKDALAALGFVFKQGCDANHFQYHHPKLRQDTIFRYPKNLFRPHGKYRDSNRVQMRDKSQAKQAIEALRAITESSIREDQDDEQEEQKY